VIRALPGGSLKMNLNELRLKILRAGCGQGFGPGRPEGVCIYSI